MVRRQTKKHKSEYITNKSIPHAVINTLTQYLRNKFDVPDLKHTLHLVRNAVQTLEASSCENQTEWALCENTCAKTLRALIKTETESTAYMLRALTNSVISVDGHSIEFEITPPLTGLWADDAANIRIRSVGNPKKRPRLMIGLGPSASGKTFWTKKLIKMFAETDENFPKTFLTIDGGIYRSSSIVYQYIVQAAKESCFAGIQNLVEANMHIGDQSLFYAGKIKQQMKEFLRTQSPISLYVPETCSDCGFARFKSCEQKHKPYIDITKDNDWIAVLLWQHKRAEDCHFEKQFRCVGCTESGERRETQEGKKYSNTMYEHSMNEGMRTLLRSPNIRYKIHVSGSDDRKSIVEDYSENPVKPTEDCMNKYNYVYRMV